MRNRVWMRKKKMRSVLHIARPIQRSLLIITQQYAQHTQATPVNFLHRHVTLAW
jgi:hypothetical protein